MEKSSKSKKRLQTAKELPLIIAEYYRECHEAKIESRPVRVDAPDERWHRTVLRHGPPTGLP